LELLMISATKREWYFLLISNSISNSSLKLNSMERLKDLVSHRSKLVFSSNRKEVFSTSMINNSKVVCGVFLRVISNNSLDSPPKWRHSFGKLSHLQRMLLT
jgi:hypothetical protein